MLQLNTYNNDESSDGCGKILAYNDFVDRRRDSIAEILDFSEFETQEEKEAEARELREKEERERQEEEEKKRLIEEMRKAIAEKEKLRVEQVAQLIYRIPVFPPSDFLSLAR